MLPVARSQRTPSHEQQSTPTHDESILNSSLTLYLNLIRASLSCSGQPTVIFEAPKQVYVAANVNKLKKIRRSRKPHWFLILQAQPASTLWASEDFECHFGRANELDVSAICTLILLAMFVIHSSKCSFATSYLMKNLPSEAGYISFS
ncbi:hypothetical protein CTI12_AA598450 [Artemisia annua]|uniref:Uncharacterized protein n=1 Tax=Artemisia annua TaxID=35608 RepID=A0A2U1KIM4_ARTAN|nr:hypothetical protein CTI12_AA598450 [Artemisia annua]